MNVSASPSEAAASLIVTDGVASSSRIVPVAVTSVPSAVKLRLTVKVSSASSTASSVVATVKVWVSPAVPAKLISAVFSV